MKKLMLLAVLVFVNFQIAFAEESKKSAYGINYQEYTFNEILTDFMYDIEPKLLKYYATLNLPEDEIIWGLKGMAGALAANHIVEAVEKDIEATDPEATEVFIQLPKDEYSNLHLLVKHFRLKKEYKEKYGVELTEEEAKKSLRLYKALFGKEYEHKNNN